MARNMIDLHVLTYIIYSVKGSAYISREESVDKTIANAAASVEMEGYHIDRECREWCKMVLMGDLTKDEYYQLLFMKAGIIMP